MTARLAIVGAGVMGEALARGLVAAGWSPDDLVVADIDLERARSVAGTVGASVAEDARDAVGRADGALLAVKPQEAPGALAGIAGAVGETGLVSIVAGLRSGSISEQLGGAPVVRAMPNSPARVGRSVTALAAHAAAKPETRRLAEDVFSVVGPVLWLDEELLDAVTAVSGSGPAYVFYLAEAMVEAGVALGLERRDAEVLTYHTIEGAGHMLVETGTDPAELRRQVTSKGGTTQAAIEVLDAFGVRDTLTEAIRAAERRARELGS